ncbi:transporter [Rhodoplanes sp. TEM]|uniref:Transporter n=1 Tax=Rhodoplanes tepidamans TaxID=200616 RepID=A0ABT5JCV2_RHOTP|nr:MULTISPECIES: transporter [Rhodoplanes]MDC7787525.1 transporter [Rhodoplanes tepidamans]MDC7983884.1 transporter [Rhodoplanes sp. TEM]MDQ0354322.1 zinc transporter [Rhodoplanes tepidamans]
MEARPDFGSDPLPGLVWAFRIRPDGTAEELDVERPVAPVTDGWLWLHFSLVDTRGCAFLRSFADLPPDAVDALTGPDTHQQLQAEDDCVYGVFADLGRELEGVTDEVRLLHFAMRERCLVSARRRALNAVDEVRQALRAGRRIDSPATLIEQVVDHVVDAIDRLADTLALEMDRIEERILDLETTDERRKLGVFRRTTVRLHRQLAGLRALFRRFEEIEPEELAPGLRIDAVRLSQRLDGLDQEIDALRDRARMLQDELSSQLAEETNRNLRALSIVTILFLPPTLVAGFFGMNLKGIAFAEGEAGFWAGVLVSALSSLIVYMLLRWRGLTRG